MPTVPEIITESVLKQLEQGVAPWRRPWSTSIPQNLISKKPYRGLNVFSLATQGYGSPYWLTFNQAKQLGAHVRKGENSTLVSFWKCSEYARENASTGQPENKTSVLAPLLSRFQYRAMRRPTRNLWRRLEANQSNRTVRSNRQSMPNAPRIERHSHAFYRSSADLIGIPSRNCFESPEAYYSTLFHELTHSTGHSSRLRSFRGKFNRPRVRFRIVQQRRTHRGDWCGDARGNFWNLTLHSRQFRELFTSVD
jgi:antirestriction protein ArdC